MKVTLIQPKSDYWLEDNALVNKNSPSFRYSLLNLLSVAAVIPPEWEIQIIDERIDGIDFEESRDIVGISTMTPDAPRAYFLANEFRKRKITTVLGGVHPSFCPDEALQNADAIVIGEGEETFPLLLEDYRKERLKKIYRAEMLYDLGKMRPAPRNLLSSKNYITVPNIQATRGCPFRCNYCSITAFNQNTYRKRPIPLVLDELAAIEEDSILFIDDNLIGDYFYAKELFNAMIPLNKKWISQMTLSIADDEELLSLAAKSGCQQAFVGIESLSKENLANLNKTVNKLEKIEEQIKRVQDKGIDVQAAFITGLDGDDEGVFDRIYDFCERNDITTVNIWVFTPFPGTEVFRRLQSENRIISYDWSKYDFQHVVIKPKNLTPQQLQEKADNLRKALNSPYWMSKRIAKAFQQSKRLFLKYRQKN